MRVACGILRAMKTIKDVAEGRHTSCLSSIPAGWGRDGEKKVRSQPALTLTDQTRSHCAYTVCTFELNSSTENNLSCQENTIVV